MFCYKFAIFREHKMTDLNNLPMRSYYLQGHTLSSSSFVDVTNV